MECLNLGLGEVKGKESKTIEENKLFVFVKNIHVLCLVIYEIELVEVIK